MAKDNTQYQLGQIFGILEGIKNDISDIKRTVKESKETLADFDERIRNVELFKQYSLGIVVAVTFIFNLFISNAGELISNFKK